MSSKKERIVSFISSKNFKVGLLFTGGFIAFVFGSYNIIFVNDLTKDELGLKDLTISQRPTVTPYNAVAYPSLQSGHVSFIHIFFNTTNDNFAVGDSIPYTIEVGVRNPDELIDNRILVIDHQLGDDYSWVNGSNINYFMEMTGSTGHLTILTKTSPSLYSISSIYKPQASSDMIFLVIASAKNGLEKYPITGTPLHIPPASQKDQLTANRISLAQTIQQTKSNHIVEGLSWWIIAWLPFELGLNIRKEKSN